MPNQISAGAKFALDHMNKSSQLAGGLGTLLLGSVSIPSAGTLSYMASLRYSTTPALGTNTAVLGATALTAATQTISTGFTQPDFPRIVLAKGNASGITGNVVVHGTNMAGAVISDTIALSGASAVTGVKAFATITSVDLPVQTHSGTDTVSIGTGNGIGLPVALNNTGFLYVHNFGGSTDAGTLTTASTVEGTYYTPAGTLDGSTALSLYFFA